MKAPHVTPTVQLDRQFWEMEAGEMKTTKEDTIGILPTKLTTGCWIRARSALSSMVI